MAGNRRVDHRRQRRDWGWRGAHRWWSNTGEFVFRRSLSMVALARLKAKPRMLFVSCWMAEDARRRGSLDRRSDAAGCAEHGRRIKAMSMMTDVEPATHGSESDCLIAKVVLLVVVQRRRYCYCAIGPATSREGALRHSLRSVPTWQRASSPN